MNPIKEYVRTLARLVRSKVFLGTLVLATLASYGYRLFHPTLSRDDTGLFFYYNQGGLLAQGRYSQLLLPKLFFLKDLTGPMTGVVAVALLLGAGLLWAALLGQAAKGKLRTGSLALFAAFFLSYPLITEIFVFDGDVLNVSVGYFLSPLALLLALDWARRRKVLSLAGGALLMAFILPLYESFASVFLFGVLGMLILGQLYGEEDGRMKSVVSRGLLLGVPMVLGIILMAGINGVIRGVMTLPVNHADNEIVWLVKGIPEALGGLVRLFGEKFLLNALVYLPITVLFLAGLVQLGFLIHGAVKRRSASLALLWFGCMATPFLLSVVMGKIARYRTGTVIGLVVAFAFMMLFQSLLDGKGRKVLRVAGLAGILGLLAFQVFDINKWFVLETARDREEKAVAADLYGRLQAYPKDKPVVFIGDYFLSDSIQSQLCARRDSLAGRIYTSFGLEPATPFYSYRFTETNVRGYLAWSTGVYFVDEEPSQAWEYFRELGYSLCPDNLALYERAYRYLDEIVPYPDEGCIRELPDMILVNTGFEGNLR